MPESMPLVSIGVPVYNGEKYLSECLASILAQTYPNWECFVINNKSTDRSFEIAKEYASKDSRLKVITNPEFVDMTTNFNNTIKPVSPSTKYFKVVCADDWLFPEYLAKMVDIMEKNPGAGFSSSYRIDNRTVSCQGLNIYEGPVFSGKEMLRKQLLYQMEDITGSETTVLYRMETLKKIKGFPVIYSHTSHHFDTTLAFELLNISDLAFVFQVLSFTRRHEASSTTQHVDRFKTILNFREQELYRYKPVLEGLDDEYAKVRALYGWYLLKCRIRGDKKSLEWHKKRLDQSRTFSFIELMKSALRVFLMKINYRIKGSI